MKPATKLTTVLLGAVALLHLIRIFMGWEVNVNGYFVPMWISVFGVLLTGALVYFLIKEHQT